MNRSTPEPARALRRITKATAARALLAAGAHRLVRALRTRQAGGARVLLLSYHRATLDFAESARDAIPSMLVSAATLRRQLEQLARTWEIVPLSEAARVLAEGARGPAPRLRGDHLRRRLRRQPRGRAPGARGAADPRDRLRRDRLHRQRQALHARSPLRDACASWRGAASRPSGRRSRRRSRRSSRPAAGPGPAATLDRLIATAPHPARPRDRRVAGGAHRPVPRRTCRPGRARSTGTRCRTSPPPGSTSAATACSHAALPNLPLAEARREIEGCRDAIAERLGRPPAPLRLPERLPLARRSGGRCARPGSRPARPPRTARTSAGCDLFALRRKVLWESTTHGPLGYSAGARDVQLRGGVRGAAAHARRSRASGRIRRPSGRRRAAEDRRSGRRPRGRGRWRSGIRRGGARRRAPRARRVARPRHPSLRRARARRGARVPR